MTCCPCMRLCQSKYTHPKPSLPHTLGSAVVAHARHRASIPLLIVDFGGKNCRPAHLLAKTLLTACCRAEMQRAGTIGCEINIAYPQPCSFDCGHMIGSRATVIYEILSHLAIGLARSIS